MRNIEIWIYHISEQLKKFENFVVCDFGGKRSNINLVSLMKITNRVFATLTQGLFTQETFWLCSSKMESRAERVFPEEFAQDIWHSGTSTMSFWPFLKIFSQFFLGLSKVGGMSQPL